MVGAGTRVAPLVFQSEDDKNEKAVIGCKSDGRDDASPKTIIEDPSHGPCHEATSGTDEKELKFLKPMSPPKPNQKRRRKSSLKQTSSFINLDSSIDSDFSPKKGRRLSFSDENGLDLAETVYVKNNHYSKFKFKESIPPPSAPSTQNSNETEQQEQKKIVKRGKSNCLVNGVRAIGRYILMIMPF
mmetsp:Transcript_19985/g.29775  ORF Transcript_19985/g.29775 Transcript_19985/m.29775 type:complete len:186 (-) Transcript_19985:158-715(-)